MAHYTKYNYTQEGIRYKQLVWTVKSQRIFHGRLLNASCQINALIKIKEPGNELHFITKQQ